MKGKGPLGYGRYPRTPQLVICPRARHSQVPCVARDGRERDNGDAITGDDGRCRGCGRHPADLLAELARVVTEDPGE